MNIKNLKKFVEKLDKLTQRLDDKYWVNSGGCCYLAYCIAHNLEFFNIPYKIVVAGVGISDKQLRYNLKHNRGYGTNKFVGKHYYIKIEDLYINDAGYSKYTYMKHTICKSVPSECLLNVYNSSLHWNPRYDVNNNQKVFKAISNYFKSYEEKENKRTSSRKCK